MGNSCGKCLQENLAGNVCGKFLGENLVGNVCGKIWQEILAGNVCGKFLREMFAGNSCRKNFVGKGGGEKSQFKKGSNWWKFNILNRVMGSQPIRIQCGKILQEILAGNVCDKILWENLAGKGGGEKDNLRKAVIGGNLAFGIG